MNCTAMGIPQSKQIIRRHISAELDGLLAPARYGKINLLLHLLTPKESVILVQR